MIILAIDPSINNTGWAVLGPSDSLPYNLPSDLRVVAHGVWRPKAKDPYERLIVLQLGMDEMEEHYRPTDVVIETTTGKVSARHKGGGAHLSLYGAAVGCLVTHARCMRLRLPGSRSRFNVHLVTENLWTAGQPKRSTASGRRGRQRIGRHEQTLAEFGLPKKTTDHETDAIALGVWWYANRKLLAGQAIIKEIQQCPKPKKPSAKRTATRKPGKLSPKRKRA